MAWLLVDHRESERIEEGQPTDSELRSLGRGVLRLAFALLTRPDHFAEPCRARAGVTSFGMGPALIGLVGVIVGALVSGGATYMMARRAEARQARSAARLLQAELQTVVEQLGQMSQAIVYRDEIARRAEDDPEVPEAPNVWNLKSLLRIPPPQLWEEHKSLLADVLSAADWYALARAYQSIDDLRVISSSERWFTTEGEFIYHEVEEVVTDLGTEIRAGATAVSRLAGGGTAWRQSPEVGTTRWYLVAKSKSEHPEGSAQNEASDLSPTDPSSNPSALG